MTLNASWSRAQDLTTLRQLSDLVEQQLAEQDMRLGDRNGNIWWRSRPTSIRQHVNAQHWQQQVELLRAQLETTTELVRHQEWVQMGVLVMLDALDQLAPVDATFAAARISASKASPTTRAGARF